MSFFKKLIKKRGVDLSQRKTVFTSDYNFDRTDFRTLLSASICSSMVIQENSGELIVKEQNWMADMEKGTLTFGTDSYPVQFIGSESEISNTFLWGWENVNKFDDSVLSFVNDVKAKSECDVFSMASFELDELFNGHHVSIIATAMSNNHYVYYKGPYDNGAALLAYSGVFDEVFEPVDVARFISTVNRCISMIELDHKVLVKSFLIWNGNDYVWENDTIKASFKDTDIIIEFERVNDSLRIKSMKHTK